MALCKTRCRSYSLVQMCTLIAFAPLTRSFSWSLAASKVREVSNNDIHALKSICGHLADKESAFRNITETEYP